jgi:hypothetical protein
MWWGANICGSAQSDNGDGEGEDGEGSEEGEEEGEGEGEGEDEREGRFHVSCATPAASTICASNMPSAATRTPYVTVEYRSA